MQALRQFGSSLLLGIISFLLILGGMSTALAEKNISNPPVTITETSLPGRDADTPPAATITPASPGLLPITTESASPTSTATIPPSSSCPAPAGWYSYIVRVGDTLANVAARYKITESALQEANCLIGGSLIPDTRIYVPSMPPMATATTIIVPCGAPYGWVRYTVRAGDTLFSLARAYGVTVPKLQNANCLGSSTYIQAGKQIYVPNIPTRTPYPSATPTASQTNAPSSTPLPASQTATPTNLPPTSTATATASKTALPTGTATATASKTAFPTATATATKTNTPVPSLTFTFTPEP